MTNIKDFYGCEINDTIKHNPDIFDTDGLIELLNIIKPKPCPFPLIRVGGTTDGAYLVPDDLAGIKACFSPGVCNFKHFEDQLTDDYGIECHMVDKSSDLENFSTPLKPGLQTFDKKWLDVNGADDCISLDSWVEQLCPNATDDLILQIDIEGAEYRNLLYASESTLKRFRIIVVELHGLSDVLSPAILDQVFRPLLKKLDSMFVCVHAHPNNCCGETLIPSTDLNLPNVHELTFLRRDRAAATSSTKNYPVQIPHPLDILRNVATNPPLFLSEGWMDHARSAESKLKILEDIADSEKNNSARASANETAMYEISRQIYRSLISGKTDDHSDREITDLAARKSFSVSSHYGDYPSHGQVTEGSPFFFHTNLGLNESITIDLGQPCCLRKIRIRNRLDGFQDRANFLFYAPHESSDRTGSGAYPIQFNEDFLTGKTIECETLVPGFVARYVTIFSTNYTALHFSAVQILGEITSG